MFVKSHTPPQKKTKTPLKCSLQKVRLLRIKILSCTNFLVLNDLIFVKDNKTNAGGPLLTSGTR